MLAYLCDPSPTLEDLTNLIAGWVQDLELASESGSSFNGIQQLTGRILQKELAIYIRDVPREG